MVAVRAPASFSVRSYQAGDEEQILALFNHVFRQARGMEHWRWKFLGNPAGRQITLAVAGDRIVGQFAGLPAAAAGPGGPFVLSQGIDHMVDPEFQKRGVFAAMTRHFTETWLPPAHDVVFYSYPLAHKHSIDQRISRAELVHPVTALRSDLGARGAVERRRLLADLAPPGRAGVALRAVGRPAVAASFTRGRRRHRA